MEEQKKIKKFYLTKKVADKLTFLQELVGNTQSYLFERLITNFYNTIISNDELIKHPTSIDYLLDNFNTEQTGRDKNKKESFVV